MNREIWFAFLWGIGLSDHLGDVAGEVEQLGKILELETPECGTDGYVDWLKERGWGDGSPSLWVTK